MTARIFVLLIRIYQWTLGTVLPRSCRFYPSCSEYAREAVSRHGLRIGTRLAISRLLRCHPFHPGGYDPVPDQWPIPKKEVRQ